MARIDNLSNYLTDVSSAIKNKLGDQTPIPAEQFDTKIASIPSGGGPTTNGPIKTTFYYKDVNTGKNIKNIIYSDPGDTVKAPTNVGDVDGVIFQGWNVPEEYYTTAVTDIVVGATYAAPEDCYVEFVVELNEFTGKTVASSGGNTTYRLGNLDYGDGTPPEYISSNFTHTYADYGRYTIKVLDNIDRIHSQVFIPFLVDIRFSIKGQYLAPITLGGYVAKGCRTNALYIPKNDPLYPVGNVYISSMAYNAVEFVSFPLGGLSGVTRDESVPYTGVISTIYVASDSFYAQIGLGGLMSSRNDVLLIINKEGINLTLTDGSGKYSATNLNYVIRGTQIPNLSFEKLPDTIYLTNPNMRIFVEDSLLESYKTATNWNSYAPVIFPISQYLEERIPY